MAVHLTVQEKAGPSPDAMQQLIIDESEEICCMPKKAEGHFLLFQTAAHDEHSLISTLKDTQTDVRHMSPVFAFETWP